MRTLAIIFTIIGSAIFLAYIFISAINNTVCLKDGKSFSCHLEMVHP